MANRVSHQRLRPWQHSRFSSSPRRYGLWGQPYLGASLGALLISSDFINAYSASTAIAEGTMVTLDVIPGIYSIDWVGYQGHVIPILVGVWIALCFFEKRLHKVVPEMFDLFLTPLLSVSLAAYITDHLFVGPIFVWLENNILGLLMWLLQVPFGIGYIIIGLIYSPSVVTGLHQMYTAIDVSMLAQYGVTYWLPITSAASIAQGGTCLAVALKTHSEKTKSLAVPAGISCLLGITEPAIFGVNLPNMKPFVAGMIGSACGALCCFIFNLAASGTGVTGIFGILLCIAQPLQYVIMFAVAFGVAFAISSAVYRDKDATAAPEKVAAQTAAAADEARALRQTRRPRPPQPQPPRARDHRRPRNRHRRLPDRRLRPRLCLARHGQGHRGRAHGWQDRLACRRHRDRSRRDRARPWPALRLRRGSCSSTLASILSSSRVRHSRPWPRWATT